jgi:lysophospholipase L1-like esterase
MQTFLRHQSHCGLSYLVVAVTLASVACATNTAIEPVSKAGNATWMARHHAMNTRAQQGHVDLIYVGDSIVEYYEQQGKDTWDRYYAPRQALNLGISGDRTQHVLWRLDHGNIDGIVPKLAIVMIGQNNGGHNTAEEIGAGVTAIVQKIRAKLPTTKILLLAIFPRRAKPTAERAVLAQASRIAATLADNHTIFSLDINQIFLRTDGSIPAELMPDFEHPSAEGYRLWAEAIEPTVATLMGDKAIAPAAP